MKENKQIQSIKKQLQYRLSRQHIFNEHYYIKRMNPKLQLTLQTFLRDPKLSNFIRQNIIAAINAMQLIQKINVNKYKLKYQNGDRIVLITGIKKQFINNQLLEFKRQSSSIGTFHDQIIWVLFNQTENAWGFKKHIRNKKRFEDEKNNVAYKIEKKRVRIIIFNEDFFTILVDAMNQKLIKLFIENFQKPNSEGVTYTKIMFTSNDNATNFQQYDDIYSQQQSKTSEVVDGQNLKDCIERIDQGIQAEKIEQTIKQKGQNIQQINYKEQTINIETDVKENSSTQKFIEQGNKNYKIEINLVQQQKSIISKNKQQDKHQQTDSKKQLNKQQKKLSVNKEIKMFESKSQELIPINKQLVKIKKNQSKNISNKHHHNSQKQQIISKISTIKYDYLAMKKLYNKLKEKTYNLKTTIPQYLTKQTQKQHYKRLFFQGICQDKFWKRDKF